LPARATSALAVVLVVRLHELREVSRIQINHIEAAPVHELLELRLPAVTRLRCWLICLARKSKFAAPYAAKQHDGQIT
jgi:hypothetical protein